MIVNRPHVYLLWQVYPSAIEAKRRHESAKELRVRHPAPRQLNSKTVLHDPDFDKRMNKQTSRWQSEYSKNYGQLPVARHQRHV